MNDDLIERLESHMGKQDVSIFIADCREAAATIRDLRAKLGELAKAEASYRHNHDLRGGGHITTGRAWDAMRRAGDEARATLARIDHD